MKHDMQTNNLKEMSFMATAHCLTGCAIGEVLGMVIGTSIGLDNVQTIILAVTLAFLFGYTLTIFPLLKAMSLKKALALAFASDTISISVMELVDNTVMVLIPGAMHANVNTLLFWESLAFSLMVAFVAAYPVNYYLISKGKGHAVMHDHHH